MTTLDQALKELTVARERKIRRDNGATETVEEDCYLETLESLIEDGARGTGGVGSSGSSSPLSLAALDLREEIAKTTEQHWPGRGRAVLRRTPLAEKIRKWRDVSTDGSLCHDWILYWCDKIRGLTLRNFDLDAACPNCGNAKLIEQDETDASNVFYKAAIVFNEDRATCRVCDSVWEGHDGMKHLAGQIAAAY